MASWPRGCSRCSTAARPVASDERGVGRPATVITAVASWLRETRKLPAAEIGELFGCETAHGPVVVFRHRDQAGRVRHLQGKVRLLGKLSDRAPRVDDADVIRWSNGDRILLLSGAAYRRVALFGRRIFNGRGSVPRGLLARCSRSSMNWLTPRERTHSARRGGDASKTAPRHFLRYRFQSVVKGRERVPVSLFPWLRAWQERVAKRSRATQLGTLAALQGLTAFAGIKAALAGIKPTGEVRAGKDQLRIDEARRFVAVALEAGDPLAVAAATMAFTGLRPGEAMALQARDVDDGGAVLWVPGTKTKAARRHIPVDAEFQPVLLGAATGKGAGQLLFDHEPQRRRVAKDACKARRDALLRRVHQLCRAAGVPEVCAHSMRGLNATLRKTGGASDDSITRALGHVSIDTTRRSYFAPGVAEAADARRAHGRLIRAQTTRLGTGNFSESSQRVSRLTERSETHKRRAHTREDGGTW